MASHVTVKIKDLVVHKLAQAPDRDDPRHVEDLKESIKAGAKLPKPQVMEIEGIGIVPYNGHHTIQARDELKEKEIAVELVKGTIEDLQVEAAKANKDQHALKRSNRTKEWAIRTYLGIKPEVSDSYVSREVGVSENMVIRVRKEMEAEGKVKADGKRLGRDGKMRKKPKKKARAAIDTVSSKFDFKQWDEKSGWVARGITALSELVGDSAGKKKALAGLNAAMKIIDAWKKKLAKLDEDAAKEAAAKKDEPKEAAKEAGV